MHPSQGRAHILALLPQWTVRYEGADLLFAARSPQYKHDGIVVEARYAEDVVVRAHALMASGWTPGVASAAPPPTATPAPAPTPAPAAPEVEPILVEAERIDTAGGIPGFDPKAAGMQEGQCCGSCHGVRMVRNGSCLKCLDCGETTGCS